MKLFRCYDFSLCCSLIGNTWSEQNGVVMESAAKHRLSEEVELFWRTFLIKQNESLFTNKLTNNKNNIYIERQ